MKIINSKIKARTIRDLDIGDVFTSEETWPGKLFMMIWRLDCKLVQFVCLSSDEDEKGNQERDVGQTYSMAKIAAEKHKVIVYDPEIILGAGS